ncbi:MAG: HEAT repeat domain-containing protein [Gammaproteobacteria bacterium]|nr:HEAT repeat domain-containing protein [Gammaproteobacteria bacterium]
MRYSQQLVKTLISTSIDGNRETAPLPPSGLKPPHSNRLLPVLYQRPHRRSDSHNYWLFLACWVYPASLPATHAETTSGDAPSTLSIILFITGLIGLILMVITALTRWSHKQDSIINMMPFCIKYLMETRNEAEKCKAAKALGKVKDPGAFLILFDIIGDQNAEPNLRKTAREALDNLSEVYTHYRLVIDELSEAAEAQDHQKSINILMENFEHKDTTYVQSAYVIAREYMRLRNYADAREWLQTARHRNDRHVVYVHQISNLIDICNEKLFYEGDVFFKTKDYYDALERYAVASHDLAISDKEHFACHLRLACVYCKLIQFEDAYQETLLALQDHHKTSSSLHLNDLLKRERGEIGGTAEAEERRRKIRKDVDEFVTGVMSRLIS